MRERRNSIANALELRLSRTNPSIDITVPQLAFMIHSGPPCTCVTGCVFQKLCCDSLTRGFKVYSIPNYCLTVYIIHAFNKSHPHFTLVTNIQCMVHVILEVKQMMSSDKKKRTLYMRVKKNTYDISLLMSHHAENIYILALVYRCFFVTTLNTINRHCFRSWPGASKSINITYNQLI